MCVQTLIRNLRDSSTRVMLVRPALWQMDTVLVDQAVEKFNLKRNNTRKCIHATAGNAACGFILLSYANMFAKRDCEWGQMRDQTAWVERYLGPISTSFSPLPSVSFGVSDSGSSCSGGRNNQRRTSFCSAPRLLQPAGGREGGRAGQTHGQHGRTGQKVVIFRRRTLAAHICLVQTFGAPSCSPVNSTL